MKPALLFPGQGSQRVGMGRDLYDHFAVARATFKEADEALGFDLSGLIFNGPEERLTLTEFTQPAIVAVSVAAARVLHERMGGGLSVAFVAGHSLGEYSAHVVAGSIDFADAIRTVRSRGRYMQEAVPAGLGSMAAILGLASETINDICAQVSDELAQSSKHLDRSSHLLLSTEDGSSELVPTVAPANLNSPDQTVISGSVEAVQRAADLCIKSGAKRTILLQVSAPFHCALMQPAQNLLATDLEAVVFNDPSVPVICNVDARAVTRRSDARDCLIRQVTAPVRWVECIQLLLNEKATPFLEVGPGKVLSGLLRQIDRSQTALNVEDRTSLETALKKLEMAQPRQEP